MEDRSSLRKLKKVGTVDFKQTPRTEGRDKVQAVSRMQKPGSLVLFGASLSFVLLARKPPLNYPRCSGHTEPNPSKMSSEKTDTKIDTEIPCSEQAIQTTRSH